MRGAVPRGPRGEAKEPVADSPSSPASLVARGAIVAVAALALAFAATVVPSVPHRALLMVALLGVFFHTLPATIFAITHSRLDHWMLPAALGIGRACRDVTKRAWLSRPTSARLCGAAHRELERLDAITPSVPN
jgi:hypothetical protein